MIKDHIVLDCRPDGVYTRHSEGAFLRLRDGRILFVYCRFTSHFYDGAPSDLVALYSCDEGETWTQPVVFRPASAHGVKNIMSVSLLRMQNGDLGLFYLVKHADGHNSYVLARSHDEGETFYACTTCSLEDRKGYIIVNNDRVVRLKSGRILIPMVYHRSGVSAEGKWYYDYHGFACFLYSDDDGATWQESPDLVYPPFSDSGTGLQETGVVEKENGVLWAYNRTDKMYQYEYFSLDGGLHWTLPQTSRFTAPDSPLHIIRRPQTGALYAIWNPIPKYNGRETTRVNLGRTPFVYAVSQDDGLTWSEYRIIEDHPAHGYCYPAVLFTEDDAMLVAYCSGGPEDGLCLARLSMKKISLLPESAEA